MKKLLVMAAALLLAAPAAAAQQAAQSPGDEPAVQQMVTQQQAATPSIFVSRQEIQQRVAAMESERRGEQIGSSSFWYLVAAVALGVLIAVLIAE
jgi:curli biogenesis system outer membrane secretion channel CsgG